MERSSGRRAIPAIVPRALLTLASLAGCGGADGDDPAAIVLNEVLAHNDAGWIDPDGVGECPEFDDFVEVFNRGATPVALGGWRLTDDPEVPDRFVFPAVTLLPGAHLVVVADEQPEQGDLHAAFGVGTGGETLVLSRPDGRIVDEQAIPALDADVSWGRYGDGGDAWRPLAAASPGFANESPPSDPCLQPMPGFDDHTAGCVTTPAGFDSLAAGRAGLGVVKFEIERFQDAGARHAVFLDSRFYALHDEWYLFRMLNGHTVPGETVYAPFPGEFATIDAIYAWAATVPLEAMFSPEFLRWAEDRLTSQRFYDLALGPVRVIGAGTLVHAPATDATPERWAFELEYVDEPTHDEIVAYFETLQAQLGPALASQLHWLVRSPAQEALAAEMEADGLPYGDRILRYSDLSAPGTLEVYRGGTVAGRVRIVHAGESFDDVDPSEILVIDEIPDYLPPCAALITGVPQTPLAHIALLAESRGIPNLALTGVGSDPEWDQWARARVPIALRATVPDGFEVVEITAVELATWQALVQPTAPVVPQVDPETLPYTVDLGSVPVTEMEDWRAGLGGKSTGYIALLGTPGVLTPDVPLGISIRGYAEQTASLSWLAPMLAAPEFGDPGDARARYLVLEGRAAYDERYAAPGDQVYADAFAAAHPAGDPLGDLARGEGARGTYAATPMLPAVRDAIVPAVEAQFAFLAPSQGIRFRSSSNVEDAEGFNGAGLYASYTGYAEPDPADGDPIEVAIRNTWASYWGAEAFEERHNAGIDPLSGAMGIAVHANFDDELEASNGVVTLTRLPDTSSDRWEMELNNQVGAISVTNPPVDACTVVLPEVVRVRATEDGAPRIERAQRSTELATGDVLDDAKVLALFDALRPVVVVWLDNANALLSPEQQRQELTLDFEYREMKDGWPARDDGVTFGQRVVVKQARTLEPSTAELSAEVLAMPFPRDIVIRAREVHDWTCTGVLGREIVATEATTDLLKTPDMGYAALPFTASLDVDGVSLTWRDFASISRPDLDTLDVVTTAEAAARTQIAEVHVSPDGLAVLGPAGADDEPLAGCETTTVWAAPDTFLDALLDAGETP